MIGFYKGRQKR